MLLVHPHPCTRRLARSAGKRLASQCRGATEPPTQPQQQQGSSIDSPPTPPVSGTASATAPPTSSASVSAAPPLDGPTTTSAVLEALRSAEAAERLVAGFHSQGPVPRVESQEAAPPSTAEDATVPPATVGESQPSLSSQEAAMRPRLLTEEERLARIQGQRADQVASWYSESRKKPDSSLAAVVRTKLAMSGPEYLEDKDRSKVADRSWDLFNLVFAIAATLTLYKLSRGSRLKYFHEHLASEREDLEAKYFDPSESNLEQEALRKYGWYFKWKDQQHIDSREKQLQGDNAPYMMNGVQFSATLRNQQVEAGRAWDSFTSLFGRSRYN